MEDIWNIFSDTMNNTVQPTTESLSCPECNCADIITAEGHSICTKCGTDMGPMLEGDDGSMYHDSSKSGNTHRLSGNGNALL